MRASSKVKLDSYRDVKENDSSQDASITARASIFTIVTKALEEAGFGEKILNTKTFPHPAHGNQKRYRDELRKLIAQASGQ